MKRRSEPQATAGAEPPVPRGDADWDRIQARIIGLGERSMRKTYYPQLRERVAELERFRKLLDQTPDVILMVDARNWTVFDCNDAAMARLGRKGALLGRPLDQVLPPSTVESLKALDGLGPASTLEVALGSGQEVYPAEITFREVAFGDKVYGVVVARDISKRKRYENQLERKVSEEGALGALLRLSLEPVPVEEFLNIAMATLLGSIPWLRILPSGGIFLAEKDGQDRDRLRLVAQHGMDPMIQKICAFVPFGRCHCGVAAQEGRIQHAACIDDRHVNGYEGMSEHGHYNVPFFDQGRTLGVIVFYLPHGHPRSTDDEAFLRRVADVLSMGVRARRGDNELSRTVEELDASQRDLERFAFIASHDLSEPLRNIVSSSQILEQTLDGRLDDDGGAGGHLARLVENAKRMTDVVNGLLDYTRASERGRNVESFDLADALDSVLSGLAEYIERSGVTIVTGDLPRLRADRAQISLVLRHLVSNAIKYRRADGAARVNVTVEREGDFWAISVADNGIGIDEAYWSKIFDPFQRLHRPADYPGTGIGLALARKIVDRHGGRLSVASVPGEGSCFTFTLPVEPRA